MSHQSAWYLGAPSVVRRWPELPDTIVIPAMSHQSAVVPESFGSGADPPDTIVIPAVFHQSVCPDVPVVIRGGFNLPDTIVILSVSSQSAWNLGGQGEGGDRNLP